MVIFRNFSRYTGEIFSRREGVAKGGRIRPAAAAFSLLACRSRSSSSRRWPIKSLLLRCWVTLLTAIALPSVNVYGNLTWSFSYK